MKYAGVLIVAGLALTGCSTQSPLQPDSATSALKTSQDLASAGTSAGAVAQAKPGYEPAYFNGQTVTINAIEVRQNVGPLEHAAADFYETVYPPDHSLWPDTPQCNPCDHAGDGIDFTDFHNHVLDSIPSNPGHGQFNALWHVFVILPADLSPSGQAAYAAMLPMKSETEVDAAVAAGVAVEIDTHFYFLCAVVNAHAAH
jgi:hypothetical protein